MLETEHETPHEQRETEPEAVPPWICLKDREPPASNRAEECRSESVLVTVWHARFGWRFGVDRLHLGVHRYWMQDIAWSHWQPLPEPPFKK